MRRPSVSVVPWPDESIPSMIWRLQAVTGFAIQPRTGLKSFKSLYDRPEADVAERLADVLGVDPVSVSGHCLAGHLGPAYSTLAWRDFRLARRWGCPACGFQTIWSRLALVTACTECGRLLSDDDCARDLAPAPARELQAYYLEALTAGRLRDDERIQRFWRLLSFHLCTGWWWSPARGPIPTSMPVGTGLGKPRDLAWRDPDWIALFSQAAWPATETVKTFREHVKATATSTLLSDVEGVSAGLGDVEAERDRLQRDIRRWGLQERHVPDHLLGPGFSPIGGCHLEAIGYAVSRAMRREVVLAHSGHRLTKEELIAGRGPLRQTREIAAINQLLAHDVAGLRILHRLAGQLATTDLDRRIDYQQRRETLTTVRTVPAMVLRRLSKPVRDRKVASRVRANPLARDAAAWLWIELAGGVLHHSPHHAAARARLAAFEHSLTPEDRLVLLEYGYEQLGAVTDDVARHHQPTETTREGQRDVG